MKLHSEQEIRNVRFLEENGTHFGTLRPTKTGLNKSILDAIGPFRHFLQLTGVHDFELQQSGREHKRTIPAALVDSRGHAVESTASLYRPHTRRGDPRLWIKGLPTIIEPGDLIICLWHAGALWVANGSRADVTLMMARAGVPHGPTGVRRADPSILEDLLSQLRKISARGFIPAPVNGSTAIGRLLESELGIQMNSSKEADFRGIEIKSTRSGSQRATLFAQVPDWSRSLYSGSGQLLKAYGHDKADGRALSCTVNVRKANAQGLYLQIDRDADLLRVRENELDPQEVVLWQLDTLRSRIALKHAETVWVEAAVRQNRDQEYLWFQSVHHTRSPHQNALIPLLQKGAITVDFLIREKSDRGYLFKVSLDKLDSLFGYSKRYLLS